MTVTDNQRIALIELQRAQGAMLWRWAELQPDDDTARNVLWTNLHTAADKVWDAFDADLPETPSPPSDGYSDADVRALSEVLTDAALRGIRYGTATLARVILDAGYRPPSERY